MKDEPINPFKETEKIELVSKSQGADSSGFQSLKVPSAMKGRSAFSESGADSSDPPDESLTPWIKRRKGTAYNRKKLILIVLAISIVAPIVAVGSAVCSFPNGPAMVLLQVGKMTGNREMILAAYKQGWANSPQYAGILVSAANDRAAVDRTAAVELYNDSVRINPNFASGYMNRGINYTELNRNDLALADYNKAIALNPHYALAYNNRGRLYCDMGNYQKALNDYAKALAVAPIEKSPYYKPGYSYYGRAMVYRNMNNYALELKDLLKTQSLGFEVPGLQKEIDYARSQL